MDIKEKLNRYSWLSYQRYTGEMKSGTEYSELHQEIVTYVQGLEAQVELNRWHYPDKGELPEIGEDDSYYERRDLLIFELKDEEEFRIGYFVDEEYDNWDETSYTVEGFVPVPEQYSVPYTGILTFTPAQVARWRYIQLKEKVDDENSNA